jgi:hypothetical protein
LKVAFLSFSLYLSLSFSFFSLSFFFFFFFVAYAHGFPRVGAVQKCWIFSAGIDFRMTNTGASVLEQTFLVPGRPRDAPAAARGVLAWLEPGLRLHSPPASASLSGCCYKRKKKKKRKKKEMKNRGEGADDGGAFLTLLFFFFIIQGPECACAPCCQRRFLSTLSDCSIV